jgi:copper ion binding protein
MSTSTYQVSGMTCEHCVRSVTEEISELAGVQEVRVDLATGRVSVDSENPLQESDVRSAVDEAGYQLVES